MEDSSTPDYVSRLQGSASFSFDLTDEASSKLHPPALTVDDDFDVAQFDWILHRSSALGIRDYSDNDQDSPLLIGEGVNFKVYRCGTYLSLRSELPHDVVAFKKLKVKITVGKTPPSLRQQDCLKSILREIYAMSTLSLHPNILKIYGFGSDYATFEDITTADIFSYNPFLVVEYAPLGSLADYLHIDKGLVSDSNSQQGSDISIDVRINLFLGVGRGIEALHAHGFIHRDVKPHNTLVFDDGHGSVIAKVADFGLSLFHGSDTGTQLNVAQYFGGTERYTAPELVDSPTSELSIEQMRKGDIYSFGITCLECLSQHSHRYSDLPQGFWQANTDIESLSLALQATTPTIEKEIRLMLSKILCEPNKREADIGNVLAALSGGLPVVTQADYILNNQVNNTGWPMNDSVTPNVFNTTTWNFLDGDESLIKTFGIAARLSALVVAAPWGMQRNLHESLKMGAKFRDSTFGKMMFLQGLCWAIGFGVDIDYDKAVYHIMEAAKKGYRPAKYTYRRLYQAFSSMDPDCFKNSLLDEDSLQDVDPMTHRLLCEIEKTHPDQYLAYASRYSEKEAWRERTLRSCPIEITYFTELRIESSSEDEMIKELQREIASLSTEVLAAYKQGQSYPIDHIVALAIVFDDSDSSLFQTVAQMMSKILISWNFHFTGFEAPISPLFLAARMGNTKAIQWLIKNGASPAYKSMLGMVGLHFLFMFNDSDTMNMAQLLSQGISLENPCIAEQTCISEQLYALVGTPMTFQIQINHQKSVDALTALENAALGSYSPIYQAGPGHLVPGIDDPMLGWRNKGHLFDELATLCIATTEHAGFHDLNQIYDDPGTSVDLAVMITMVIRAWHLHQVSHYMMHGIFYSQRLEKAIELIFEISSNQGRIGNFHKAHFALQICLFIIPTYHNELILSLFARHLLKTVSVQDLDTDLFEGISRTIENTLMRRPHKRTMIGLLPQGLPTYLQLIRRLAVSYRCHDLKAFSRVLSHQFIHKQKVEAGFVLQLIAESPSNNAISFLQTLIRFSMSNELDSSLIHMAVCHAIQKGNGHSLDAFFRMWGVSCLVRDNGVNIFHLLCTEDGFANLLEQTVNSLGKPLANRLIRTRESRGGLLPMEVALLSGSTECMRVLLRIYVLEGLDINNVVDTLVLHSSELHAILSKLMYHFYTKTWYFGRLLAWHTDIYIYNKQGINMVPTWGDWYIRRDVGICQLTECIAQITGLENAQYIDMKQNLIAKLKARNLPGIDQITNSPTGEINKNIKPDTVLQLHSSMTSLAKQWIRFRQTGISMGGKLVGGLALAAMLVMVFNRVKKV